MSEENESLVAAAVRGEEDAYFAGCDADADNDKHEGDEQKARTHGFPLQATRFRSDYDGRGPDSCKASTWRKALALTEGLLSLYSLAETAILRALDARGYLQPPPCVNVDSTHHRAFWRRGILLLCGRAIPSNADVAIWGLLRSWHRFISRPPAGNATELR